MSKRPRIPSPASDSPSLASPPTSKVTRIVEAPNINHPLLCTLPPTCHRKPTPLANVKDLESHYATYHAHVCEEPGCKCVFPEARLLELHQTECHDPLAAIRKQRGEKIFACHLAPPTCTKVFQTPKARRLHLIQLHGYPKEYFFSVTNKGVGGLLKKWGEGASMVRKPWKSREENDKTSEIEDEKEKDKGDTSEDSKDVKMEEQHTDGEDLYDEDGEETAIEDDTPTITNNVDHPSQNSSGNVDSLAQSMSALSLVPSSVRFGRGGQKHVGLAPPTVPEVPHHHHPQRGMGVGRPNRGRVMRGRGFHMRGGPGMVAEQRTDVEMPAGPRGRGMMPRGMLHVARAVPPRGFMSRGRPPMGRINPGWVPRGRGRGGQ